MQRDVRQLYPRTHQNKIGLTTSSQADFHKPRIQARAALLLANPGLRTTEQRHADVTAHDEFLAAVFKRHLALVDLAVLRVENVAAVPVVAFLFMALMIVMPLMS